MRYLLSILASIIVLASHAQIGEHRNEFSIGISGGYVMDKIDFLPTVNQKFHTSPVAGLAVRYTAEKYFSTLCAVQLEVNLAQKGWNEDIKTYYETDVINPETKLPEEYKRTMTYVEVPFLAHLSWGKEKNGVCGFVNLGPQFGYMLSEKTTKNYDRAFTSANFPNLYSSEEGRVNQVVAQESMPVELKFDYGITAGGGVELHLNKIGRFSLEARYYYGLGNIYGDSKKDFFGASRHTTIYIKLGYFHEI